MRRQPRRGKMTEFQTIFGKCPELFDELEASLAVAEGNCEKERDAVTKIQKVFRGSSARAIALPRVRLVNDSSTKVIAA